MDRKNFLKTNSTQVNQGTVSRVLTHNTLTRKK